ncbi:hypothetical protein [Pelomonas sp. KK5]|uniref:hypothetical protein n=1 Tax=Pelomonas sp. KK5 TaxID=1855730 RepID=UPI00097C5838|nr:hypothetical protein [Pelomonas sp. KK5]
MKNIAVVLLSSITLMGGAALAQVQQVQQPVPLAVVGRAAAPEAAHKSAHAAGKKSKASGSKAAQKAKAAKARKAAKKAPLQHHAAKAGRAAPKAKAHRAKVR